MRDVRDGERSERRWWRLTPRGFLLVVLVPAMGSLAWAAVAWACTFGSELQISPQQGKAGTVIDGSGSDFYTAASGGGEVSLHWNSLAGSTVWAGMPDANGNISFSFAVPANAKPGWYTLVSTQAGEHGYARAPFEVIAATPSTPAGGRSPTHKPSPAPAHKPSPAPAHKPSPAPAHRVHHPVPSTPSTQPSAAAAQPSGASSAAKPSNARGSRAGASLSLIHI